MIKVLGKVVALEPILEDKTEGGLFIAENVIRPHAERARVVAISDAEEVTSELKVGDEVFYYRFAGKGTEFTYEGKEIKFVSILDIYGVIEPDEEISNNN